MLPFIHCHLHDLRHSRDRDHEFLFLLPSMMRCKTLLDLALPRNGAPFAHEPTRFLAE
jgi:hypothetical protein